MTSADKCNICPFLNSGTINYFQNTKGKIYIYTYIYCSTGCSLGQLGFCVNKELEFVLSDGEVQKLLCPLVKDIVLCMVAIFVCFIYLFILLCFVLFFVPL